MADYATTHGHDVGIACQKRLSEWRHTDSIAIFDCEKLASKAGLVRRQTFAAELESVEEAREFIRQPIRMW